MRCSTCKSITVQCPCCDAEFCQYCGVLIEEDPEQEQEDEQ